MTYQQLLEVRDEIARPEDPRDVPLPVGQHMEKECTHVVFKP